MPNFKLQQTKKGGTMTDPHHLRAMMQGDLHKHHSKKQKSPKSALDKELDKEIDAYVDSMPIEEDPNPLQSSKMKRESIRHDIKEAVQLPELSKLLESAVGLIFLEGAKYLTSEQNHQLIADFTNASTIFSNLHLSDTTDKNLQELTQISDDSMKSMVTIAIAKFTEERFEDSLALFSLLSILNPAYSEYWFRMGIAAQKCQNYELASRAYEAATQLDPKLIGARLFASECFTERQMPDQARAEIAAAKKIAEENPVDQMWLDLLQSLESTLK
jgi:tetratricopeptide (TPR) repeat protein